MPQVDWGKMKTVNDWLQKSVAKERARLTNAPKAHKGDKFSVPENFSNFVPNPRLLKDARRSR